MAGAIVSIVLERLADVIQKQIQEEVNLVRGVKKEVLYLSSELNSIRNVLDDAERKGYKEKSVQNWLGKLEDTSYDIADVLDEWNFAILKLQIEGSDNSALPKQKVCPFIQCLCFKEVTTSHKIAKKIKVLKERLEMIVKEKDRYDFIVGQPVDPRESGRVRSTSLVDVSEIHGREADKDVLVSKLMVEGTGQEEFGLCVTCIVGAGGIGKTTIAQQVYNDDRVTNCFELRIWICVSDVFDEVRIAKGIVEIVKGSSPNLNELESLLKCVTESISGKKFLLVLDDVWTEDYTKWEPLKNSLKCGGLGSKILVTTRSERVARMMGTMEIHHLGQLSDTDCWLLMSRIAFSGRRDEDRKKLQDIGRNIANKCKGLPLAAKVLGSLLHFKDTIEEWENVLQSEIWQLEEAEVDLFPHLYLSYNELSPAMKHCFSYCAIFPKDSEIDVEKMIRMWTALGYLSSSGSTCDLELRGKEYFNNLTMRSFFQVGKFGDRDSCKMHDILHDFAQFIRKPKSQDLRDLTGRGEAKTKDLCQACDPSLVSQIKVYRSLVCQKELPWHLFECATCLRVLSLCKYGLQENPVDIENLIHLRYLDMSGNKLIQEIPQTICKLYNLQTLYLSHCELEEIPREIGNLIHLSNLDLSDNELIEKIPQTMCKLYNLETFCLGGCGLKEIPEEIGNLIQLRHLNLEWNSDLTQLPETICNLHDLQTLNLTHCIGLCGLPEGIHRLINLRHLLNDHTHPICRIPQGLEQLTGLRPLRLFHAGRGWSKLGYSKNLNQLSGTLELRISLHDREDVLEAHKAELRNKIHIQCLYICFVNEMVRTDEEELVRNEAMEALQPPLNLHRMAMLCYRGSKFPGWITSSLNHLRVLQIQECNYCSILPPLGKLPCLEELSVWEMRELQFLGREFLGITGDVDASLPSSVVVIGFPKLKALSFRYCDNWKEWEDITAEEGVSATVSIMPCLKELEIERCGLTVLPHRLLSKAFSLENLTIRNSFHLWKCYGEKEGSRWRSLSHIPHVEVHY